MILPKTLIPLHRAFCFVVLYIAAFPAWVQANADDVSPSNEGELKIAGSIIPGLFQARGDSPYNRVYDMTTAGYQGQIKLIALPIRRASRDFFDQQVDCVFVGSDDASLYAGRGHKATDILFSDAINKVSVRAFTRPEDPVINNKNDLEGKSIAVDLGANSLDVIASLFLPNTIKPIPTQSPSQALALLRQDRVDVAVAFDYDVKIFIASEPDAANFMYATDFALMTNNDVYACWRSVKTEKFLQHVNGKLATMRADGSLNAILGY